MEVPSPELTASLVSLLTYKFLDPIVFTVRVTRSISASPYQVLGLPD